MIIFTFSGATTKSGFIIFARLIFLLLVFIAFEFLQVEVDGLSRSGSIQSFPDFSRLNPNRVVTGIRCRIKVVGSKQNEKSLCKKFTIVCKFRPGNRETTFPPLIGWNK